MTTNERCELIFVDPTYLLNQLSESYNMFLFDLEYSIVREDLSRFSLYRFQDAVKSYESEDPEQMELARDFKTIFEILERSIDMDYEVIVD